MLPKLIQRKPCFEGDKERGKPRTKPQTCWLFPQCNQLLCSSFPASLLPQNLFFEASRAQSILISEGVALSLRMPYLSLYLVLSLPFEGFESI